MRRRPLLVILIDTSLLAVPRAIAGLSQSPDAFDRCIAGEVQVPIVRAMPVTRGAARIAVVVIVAAAG